MLVSVVNDSILYTYVRVH